MRTATSSAAKAAAPLVSTEKDYVMGLEKGLMVIELFASAKGPMTLSEIARETGHSRASVRRCLLTLCTLGYAKVEGRLFSLEPRALRLGHAYVVSTDLLKIAQPVLEMLSEKTGESASLAVLDAQDAVFVARSTRRHDLSFGLTLGARLPAFCSATGRVLLAALAPKEAAFIVNRMTRPMLTPKTETRTSRLMVILAQVRKQGYAICDEEIELGLRSIAIPVSDARGRTIAALSLAPATSTVKLAELADAFLPALQSASYALVKLGQRVYR